MPGPHTVVGRTMHHSGTPPRRSRIERSMIALLAPYRLGGRRSSGPAGTYPAGQTSWVEVKMQRRTPAPAMASIRWMVPRVFTRYCAPLPVSARSVRAARWTTASGATSPTTSATRFRSSRSQSRNLRRWLSADGGTRSAPHASQPAASSRWRRWRPMNPELPVTRTLPIIAAPVTRRAPPPAARPHRRGDRRRRRRDFPAPALRRCARRRRPRPPSARHRDFPAPALRRRPGTLGVARAPVNGVNPTPNRRGAQRAAPASASAGRRS